METKKSGKGKVELRGSSNVGHLTTSWEMADNSDHPAPFSEVTWKNQNSISNQLKNTLQLIWLLNTITPIGSALSLGHGEYGKARNS